MMTLSLLMGNIDTGVWEKMSNLGSAMPGTDIACTVFKTTESKIR
jgi:hypothetical protein